jgi:hypothetical protein
MRIGFSIFLLAVGAILTFAVNYTVVGVDINIVGWILMAAGVIGLVLTMVVLMPRERRVAAGEADPRFAPRSAAADSTTTAPPSNVA